MNKLFSLLKKRITLGFVITTLITFILAIILRYICELYFGLVIVRGGINKIDISYFGIVVGIKLLVSALTELITGDTYNMPIGNIRDHPMNTNNSILNMDGNKNSVNDNKEKIANSTKGKQSPSALTVQEKNANASITPTPSKMLTIDETLKLREEFKDNLNKQREMIKRLEKIKSLNDLNYYLDKKGGLELSGPSSIPDSKLESIAKEVGIIDRIINTKFAEYKELEGKDFVSNEGSLGKSYNNLRNIVKKGYDELFDKD